MACQGYGAVFLYTLIKKQWKPSPTSSIVKSPQPTIKQDRHPHCLWKEYHWAAFLESSFICYDEIADEIFKLREQREKCTVDTAARDAQIARINELQDFIKQQPAHLEAFDEALVKRWLERIIVWEDHFTVELKSGLKIDIER